MKVTKLQNIDIIQKINVDGSNKKSIAPEPKKDKVTISSHGKTLNLAKQATTQETISQERVMKVKAMIDSGSYEIDVKALAEKMIKAKDHE